MREVKSSSTPSEGIKMPQFEWDENKRLLNLEKHKIDFAEAETIYEDFVYTYQNLQEDHGEERFVSIGLLYGVEIALVFTPRSGKRRIISARRARSTERRLYYAEKQKAQL
jgi:uncharacterized DUF497 family protein